MHALKALWPGSTIKKWLGSNTSDAKPEAAPATKTTAAPARPQAPVQRVQQPNPKTAPAPAPAPKAPVAHAAAPVGEERILRLPLKPIFDRLSPALKALANAEQMSDTDEIVLAVDNILTQLPGGVVRISFGELRNAAPAGIFGDQAAHDYTLIDVPLSEVLARLHPSLLSPRNNRKRIEVPEEVTGVFGKNGGGTAAIASPENFQPVQRAIKPAPVAPVAPAATVPAPSIPAAPAATPRARVVIPPPPPGGDVIQFTRAAAPAAPAPQAPATPIQPSAPIAMPAMAKQAAAPAAPVAPAAPAKPEPQVEPLVVALANVSENWPAAIKAELDQARPAAVSVAIPLSRLEGPMKTGKLNFPWSDVRQWLKPTPLLGVSAQGDVELQLPLNVIAPLFFAHPARGKVAAKKAEIDHDIPDVFGSTSQANALRELAATPIVKPAPAAPAMPPMAPAVAAQGGAATNLQLRMAQPLSTGEGHTNGADATNRLAALPEMPATFSKAPTAPKPATNGNGAHAEAPLPKIDWTPDQAVKITCGSPAVAGAMIAAEDGLMVATQLPAQFKSETLSAFVPQIFGRAAQSAAELHLPELTSVRLSFGEQQCEIFKTGKLYYVIVGKPGEELPSQVLRKIAAELTKRN